MPITVKLFATLRKGQFPESATEGKFEHYQGITIRQIIKWLNITEEEPAIIFINGRHSDLDQELKSGDTVSLFPLVGGG